MTRKLKVLVGCEISGTVRDAFLALGHDAWSCDLETADTVTDRHVVEDVREVMMWGWDLAVMHPPCTRLCNSGVRWLHVPPPGKTLDEMWDELDEGADLFSDCWEAPIERVAVENPVMHEYAVTRIRNRCEDIQYVQPYQFGDPFFKNTGLHLRGLPKLEHTNVLMRPRKGTAAYKEWSAIHRASPGGDRGKERSVFFPGIAAAMAMQWAGRVA